MKLFRIFTLMLLVVLISCNADNSATTANTKTVSIADIDKKLAVLKTENTLDDAKVVDLIESIDAFVSENKEDAKAPVFLELKAKYLTALGKNESAFAVYNTIYEDYSNYKNHSDALFMMAFIFENNLNNIPAAELNYQKYLNEFPNGDFANDAQFSLDNMSKTPEELMEMFKKMNEENSIPE